MAKVKKKKKIPVKNKKRTKVRKKK